MSGLDNAVSAVLVQRPMERNQLLIDVAKSKTTKPEELVLLYDLLLQNTSDLSDLVSSDRDQKPEEVALAEDCEVKSLAFRAERLPIRSRRCRMISAGLKAGTEHATGIMEEEKAPEHLSDKISNISLNAEEKPEKYLMEKLNVYESAVGDSDSKGSARIDPFPSSFQSIPRNPIVLDLVYSSIEFRSLEGRMKKDKRGLKGWLWGRG